MNTNPKLRGMSKAEKDRWNDAQGRAVFSGALITDKEAGMLNQMTEMTYPGQKGKHPDFGDKILEIAGTL